MTSDMTSASLFNEWCLIINAIISFQITLTDSGYYTLWHWAPTTKWQPWEFLAASELRTHNMFSPNFSRLIWITIPRTTTFIQSELGSLFLKLTTELTGLARIHTHSSTHSMKLTFSNPKLYVTTMSKTTTLLLDWIVKTTVTVEKGLIIYDILFITFWPQHPKESYACQ